jgi:hypothetical protein
MAARDLEDEISEEEEWEAEDADDIDEQENPHEYDDEEGENTEPGSGPASVGLEYVCAKCGKKKRGKGVITPSCHGKMIPLDFENLKKKKRA